MGAPKKEKNDSLFGVPRWALTSVLVVLMLTTGSVNTITKKCQFSTYSTGIDGNQETFSKPYLQSLIMFSGETLCLLVYGWKVWKRRRRRKSRLERKLETKTKTDYLASIAINETGGKGVVLPSVVCSSPSKTYVSVGEDRKKTKASVFLFLPPACCDVLGTTFAGLSLIYLSASIFQMLRGSILVFTGFFSMVLLRRRLKLCQWVGIVIVCFGLALVGVASFLSDEASMDQSVSEALLGIVFCLTGQACNGFQFVLEESFLKNKKKKVDPEQIVGTEGSWGCMIMILIVLPYCYVLPGSDVGGRAENTANSVVLIRNNPLLLLFIGLYWLSIAFFNFYSLTMARHLTSVHRTLIDTLRTICVWGIELVLYFIFRGNDTYKYGEGWTVYSWIELAGFVFLVVGTAVHNDVISPLLHWRKKDRKLEQ